MSGWREVEENTDVGVWILRVHRPHNRHLLHSSLVVGHNVCNNCTIHQNPGLDCRYMANRANCELKPTVQQLGEEIEI